MVDVSPLDLRPCLLEIKLLGLVFGLEFDVGLDRAVARGRREAGGFGEVQGGRGGRLEVKEGVRRGRLRGEARRDHEF